MIDGSPVFSMTDKHLKNEQTRNDEWWFLVGPASQTVGRYLAIIVSTPLFAGICRPVGIYVSRLCG